MANFGYKVSPPGVNVLNAPDYKLSSSSLFLGLRVLHEGLFHIVNSQLTYNIQAHNLGYNPMFMVFADDPDHRGRWRIAAASPPFGGMENLGMDESKLTWFGDTDASETFDIYYFIFENKLDEPFESPITQSGDTTSGGNDEFGIRVAKDTKSADSTDKRDFTLDSDTREPTIHKIAYGNYSGTLNVTTNHDLGYPPLVLPYVRETNLGLLTDGKWRMITSGNAGAGDPVEVSSDNSNTTVNIASANTGEYSIVILKEPYLKIWAKV